jgi:hypothetical protein
MTARKITLMIDDELVRRTRRQDSYEAGKSDAQVVEDALAVFVGLHALDDARAQGTLEVHDADRLAVKEVRAVRRARLQSGARSQLLIRASCPGIPLEALLPASLVCAPGVRAG